MENSKIHNSLLAEMAVAKIKALYERNAYVYYTNICKELGVDIERVRKLLKKEGIFSDIKAQNSKIAYERNILYKHIQTVSIKDLKASEKKTEDPIILREIRKKARVVVKINDESDFDFGMFRRKVTGVRLRADYDGNFSEYVCGEGRSNLSY